MQIFDCSNQDQRLNHRGCGGPRENDIMRYLKENALRFGYSFTSYLTDADIAITNDIFTKEVAESSIPKIKRMDGTFYQEDLKHKNELLNEAAMKADEVIFISEYSKRSFKELYGLSPYTNEVILNCADTKIFYPKAPDEMFKLPTFVAMASDWSRPEKRLGALLRLAEAKPGWHFKLIGKCFCNVPANVERLDYIDHPKDIADIMFQSDGMISLFYKDACPKTLCQGVACGLPILYADSGGQSEIVLSGVPVRDNKEIGFEIDQCHISTADLVAAADRYYMNFNKLSEDAMHFDVGNFEYMLWQYFCVFDMYCN